MSVLFRVCCVLSALVLFAADSDRREKILAQRKERHDRLIVHEKYEGETSCTYPEIALDIDMPVFYINLDESIDRRLAMEKYYGCLDLYRIPAIAFTQDSDWLKHPFSSVPGLVDDLHGDAIDPFGKRPQKPYLEPDVLPTYLATIGCLLSHLRAAYIVASLQLPYALIFEDDMTPELFPGWRGSRISDIIAHHNFSALQLSVLGPSELFDEFARSMASKDTVAAVTGQDWRPSNGAYLLSLEGAVALRNTFFDFVTLKISIDALQCVNVDCCVMVFLNQTLTRLPPLFLHSAPPPAEVEAASAPTHLEGVFDDNDGSDNSSGIARRSNACEWMHVLGGSTLTCGVPQLRATQRKIIEQSRRGAMVLTFERGGHFLGEGGSSGSMGSMDRERSLEKAGREEEEEEKRAHDADDDEVRRRRRRGKGGGVSRAPKDSSRGGSTPPSSREGERIGTGKEMGKRKKQRKSGKKQRGKRKQRWEGQELR
jgi:hypothetical protein